ncbi:MAG: Hpt domain-containing protein [Pirellulales bacterium]|nr:Hpt domain-containing protein [Pirellulales bacterium]
MDSPRGIAAPLYSTLAADRALDDLVELFVDELPDRVARLQRLYDADERRELERAAHQLKGAAGSYGFDPLTPAAARLENALATHDPSADVVSALAELIALCNRVRAGAPR